MMKYILVIMLTTCCIILLGCGTKRHRPDRNGIEHSGFSIPVDETSVTKATKDWPDASKAAAKSMEKRYGLPGIVSNQMIIWYNSKPFKRTVVTRDLVKHSFPIPHYDVIQQTIDYRVPLGKISDLNSFDGSLTIDRTKGELSARSEKVEMNYLTLNLADKIVRNELSVPTARAEFVSLAKNFESGTSNRYLTGLTFKSEGLTADPDIIGDPGQISIEAQEEARDAAKKVREIQD